MVDRYFGQDVTDPYRWMESGSPVGYVAIVANDFIYTERPGDKERFRIMGRARAGGRPNVLVDIDGTKFTSIDYFEPSPSGRYVAYGVSSAGSEDSILHVVDSQSKSLVVARSIARKMAMLRGYPAKMAFCTLANRNVLRELRFPKP